MYLTLVAQLPATVYFWTYVERTTINIVKRTLARGDSLSAAAQV